MHDLDTSNLSKMFRNFIAIALQEAKSATEREEITKNLLEKIVGSQTDDRSTAPEFDSDLEWFNTTEPLFFKSHLKGKLVVLDFFTYCCINCMHILPDLEALENEFSVEDGLAVIGVHSAKFENEKTSANILNAVLRYNITHPVVNDYTTTLWDALDITCWPTLLIIGPSGEVILPLVGEGHKDVLFDVCRTTLNYFKSKNQISNHSLPLQLFKDTLPSTPLSFPGKIHTSPEGNKLVVADSGHHRIIIASTEGVVLKCVGGKEAGFNDGDFEAARFHSPQGVCWTKGNTIYVADTENHAIRKIDLCTDTVTTVAGTGVMGSDKLGGSQGPVQPLSSPWDVTLGTPQDDILYIAMAGNHNIWGLFMETQKWMKGIEHKKGTCMAYAGSGKEENRNNSYPHRASFAQPSGLAVAPEEPFECMFVADSESSTIRSVLFKNGAVKGVVGGERDPMNLFAFGDVDGVGIDAKLQHPLGVAWNSEQKLLYVADSYNHKIKVVDPISKTCTSFAGGGIAGKADSTDPHLAWFNEPGGLCVSPDNKKLYIADTNNHAIRVIDLHNKDVKELRILFSSENSSSETVIDSGNAIKPITSKRSEIITLDPISVTMGNSVEFVLDVQLPQYGKLTEDAPSSWQIYQQEENILIQHPKRITSLQEPIPSCTWTSPISPIESTDIRVEVVIYHCQPSGVCLVTGLVFDLPVEFLDKSHSSTDNVLVKLSHRIVSDI